MGLEMTGCHAENGAMLAWVTMPTGVQTAWQLCVHDHPGHECKTPGVAAAYRELCRAVSDAVTLQMLESVPTAPDTPPSILLIKPCRVCDAKTIGNQDDARGYTFCPDHRSLGQT